MSKYLDDSPLLTQEEIDRRKNRTITMTKDDCLSNKNMDKHIEKYDFFHMKDFTKIGQHFLYEKFEYTSHSPSDADKYLTISYPKLGIYLNSYPCDQTIELEWVDHRRSWEYNFKFNEYCFVGEQKVEPQYLALWSDQMMVYGSWDAKPDWKQLKQAYERTWWYYRDQDELRDIQIDRLLGKNSDL